MVPKKYKRLKSTAKEGRGSPRRGVQGRVLGGVRGRRGEGRRGSIEGPGEVPRGKVFQRVKGSGRRGKGGSKGEEGGSWGGEVVEGGGRKKGERREEFVCVGGK